MKKHLSGISAALAATLLLAGQAKAAYDFTYTTTDAPPPPYQIGVSGLSTLSLLDVTSPSPTQDPTITPFGVGISLNQVAVNTSSPTTDGPTVIPVTTTITISPTSGGSGILTVIGSITVSAGNSSQDSSYSYTGGVTSVTIGTTTYSYDPATIGYAQPTSTTSATPYVYSGGLSLNITANAVPEPASLAMLGVGGLLVVAPRLRRLARARRA